MLAAPGRGPFQLLDWIMSRHVHECLDVAGRPVGEGRAAAFRHVETRMQTCPYAGGRHQHGKPMNVSALRQILPVWEEIVTLLSWLAQLFRPSRQTEVTTCDDLALVAGAGIFLADFLVLRGYRPLRSGEIPVVISGLYKVCLGFQLATFLGSMRERFADAKPERLPDAAGFYANLEAQDLLIGESEVCAGSPAMIMEAFEAMTNPRVLTHAALPADCTRLEIDWKRFDHFTRQAAEIWNDLVLYAIQEPQFHPQLADDRLPPDVAERLNAALKRRSTELLAKRQGLAVEIARAGQESCGISAAAWAPDPAGAVGQSPSALAGIPAEAVLAWLSGVAPADVEAHGSTIARALETQLAHYGLYEASVLAKLNEHLRGVMDALGLGAPAAPLAVRALSQVCGPTLRDWAEGVSYSQPG